MHKELNKSYATNSVNFLNKKAVHVGIHKKQLATNNMWEVTDNVQRTVQIRPNAVHPKYARLQPQKLAFGPSKVGDLRSRSPSTQRHIF